MNVRVEEVELLWYIAVRVAVGVGFGDGREVVVVLVMVMFLFAELAGTRGSSFGGRRVRAGGTW